MIAPHLAGVGMKYPEAVVTMSVQDDITTVSVSGPMLRDDHQRVVKAIGSALASPSPNVVLALDSPGGEADFLMQSVRTARDMIARSGKRVVAWVPAVALSAAYAWACACDEIYAAPEALVGSIGVIQFLADTTAATAAQGVRLIAVTSGTRKADGSPDVEATSEVIASAQTIVDGLADSFFELVSEARGVSVKEVSSLQGGTMVAKLAGTLINDTIARSDLMAGVFKGNKEMSTISEMLAAIQAAAAEGDEEAIKALATLTATDDEEKPDAAATSNAEETPPPFPPKDDEEKEAKAASSPVIFKAMKAQLAAQKQELKQIRDEIKRDKLLASRTDLAPETLAVLRGASLEGVQTTLKALGPAPDAPVAAAVRGDTRRSNVEAAAVPNDATYTRRLRMGLVKKEPAIVRSAKSIKFGVMVPDVKAGS